MPLQYYLFIQVGHFTLDNAANNETWMKELETILLTRDIPFDWADNRIMYLLVHIFLRIALTFLHSGAFRTSYKSVVIT
jgi:hypothetical protein